MGSGVFVGGGVFVGFGVCDGSGADVLVGSIVAVDVGTCWAAELSAVWSDITPATCVSSTDRVCVAFGSMSAEVFPPQPMSRPLIIKNANATILTELPFCPATGLTPVRPGKTAVVHKCGYTKSSDTGRGLSTGLFAYPKAKMDGQPVTPQDNAALVETSASRTTGASSHPLVNGQFTLADL